MPDKQVCEENSVNDAAKEAFETLLEISKILNTGLDHMTLSFCVRLCENGVHPEALAKVINEIRNQVNLMKNDDAKSDQ